MRSFPLDKPTAHTDTKQTLIWGTANPEGDLCTDGYFLSQDDIADAVHQINDRNCRGEPLPVHVEHAGVPIGRVVSAWEHKGKLECVLALDETVLEGSLSSEFVRAGLCKDLSLGYHAECVNSASSSKVTRKIYKEVSVVKTGLRHKCHIHGVSSKKT